MECYLLSELIEIIVRSYRNGMLDLLLNKGMFLVSEQTVVDQANNIHMKSVTNELEIQELEKNLVENDISKEKKEVLIIQVIT